MPLSMPKLLLIASSKYRRQFRCAGLILLRNVWIPSGCIKKKVACPPPDLLILGLEKSDRSSLDILKAIREDGGLRKLPVVIVSWSDDEALIRSFYEHRCNTYVQSCEDQVEMLRKVRTVCDYWLTVATLPSKALGL